MLSVAPLVIPWSEICDAFSPSPSPAIIDVCSQQKPITQRRSVFRSNANEIFLTLPCLLGQYEWIEPGAVIRLLEIARRKSSRAFRAFHSLLRSFSPLVLDEDERVLLF